VGTGIAAGSIVALHHAEPLQERSVVQRSSAPLTRAPSAPRVPSAEQAAEGPAQTETTEDAARERSEPRAQLSAAFEPARRPVHRAPVASKRTKGSVAPTPVYLEQEEETPAPAPAEPAPAIDSSPGVASEPAKHVESATNRQEEAAGETEPASNRPVQRAVPSPRPAVAANEPAPKNDAVAEMQGIARARALLGSDPAAAVAELVKLRREHPNGFFVEERRALTILALARAGNGAAAHEQGTAFLKRYPNGPFTDRVRAAISK
jgi:hypothetical protein